MWSTKLSDSIHAAPGVPPQNVLGMSDSPTTILLQWEPPPRELSFGIIRQYMIRFIPLNTTTENPIVSEVIVSAEKVSQLLDNLVALTNYSIEIAATTIDTGPYSDPIYITTAQAEGKTLENRSSVRVRAH